MASMTDYLSEYGTDRGELERFIKESLTDYLEDIAQYGADSGFPYITYTSDTVLIFDHFNDAILEMLFETAFEFGQSAPEMVLGFGRSDMGYRVTRMLAVENDISLEGLSADNVLDLLWQYESKFDDWVHDVHSWKNLMVWFVAEEVARREVA